MGCDYKVLSKKKFPMSMLLFVVVALAFTASAWGSIAPSCSTPGGPISTYPDPPTGNGCQSGNIQFSNFNVAPITGSSYNVGSGTYIIPVNTWASDALAPDIILSNGTSAPDSIHMTTAAPGIPHTSTACDSNGFTPNAWCVQGNGTNQAVQITYLETAASGNISLMSLSAMVTTHSSGSGSTAGGTALVIREFCPGATTFAQGCTNYGYMEAGLVNGKFQQDVLFSQLVDLGANSSSNVAVRDTIWLASFNGAGSFAYISYIDGVTPEPATYGMVGLALAGLGALRFRKRKS
jgi:hypothetical protein